MSTGTTMTASGNAAWLLISAALALFYGGMTSRKAILNMRLMSFGALGVVSMIYVLWGWSMSYGA